jgi:hypothetical protein
LKIWITPFASVAMLEKLALLKIALCRAPAWSSASSACLRVEWSAASETSISVSVLWFSIVMVLPRLTCGRPTHRMDYETSKRRCKQVFKGIFQLIFSIGLLQEVCVLDKERFHFGVK